MYVFVLFRLPVHNWCRLQLQLEYVVHHWFGVIKARPHQTEEGYS